MDHTQLPPIAQRGMRLGAAVNLQEPDRVPFVPQIGNFYCLGYDVSLKDGMTDFTSVYPAIDKYLADVQPDLFNSPPVFPIPPMARLDAQYFDWPGKKPEYGDNFIYQMHDHCFLEEEEYESFIKDPQRYLMQRVLPQKFPALQGLAMLDPYSLCGSNVMGFASLGMPPAQEALKALMDAGAMTAEHIGKITGLSMQLVEKGYPLFGSATVLSPFDDFADCVRGLLNTVMDLKTCPELLAEAVDRYADVTIASGVGLAKMTHQQYLYIPLHCGVDEFMSLEDYEKYYWPPLKKLIMAAIAADLTPIVFCEGNYYSRLDILRDVPKGKVVYMFEKMDMALAKKKLGDVACIGGNLDINTLTYGTKEDVVEETKRLLDVCAPGGGYWMSNNIIIDRCKRENLIAWYEATLKYGSYR